MFAIARDAAALIAIGAFIGRLGLCSAPIHVVA
ncbi:hypothetical protein BH10PSE9_BH10PSE9_10240 [soil metagenome]